MKVQVAHTDKMTLEQLKQMIPYYTEHIRQANVSIRNIEEELEKRGELVS